MDRKDDLNFDKISENKDIYNAVECACDRESSVESFRTNSSRLSTATEADFIDVDDIELSDEESWLYKSPKNLSTANGIRNSCEKSGAVVKSQHTNNSLLNQMNNKKEIDPKCKETLGKNKEIETSNCDIPSANLDQFVLLAYNSLPSECAASVTKDCSSKESLVSAKNKENNVLNVSDVEKIARIQEESLKQSSSKFFTLSGKNTLNDRFSDVEYPKLNKPASVEALNICNGGPIEMKLNSSNSMQKIYKQNYMDSNLVLTKKDIHRGSLPDINPGYYSLKARKSRKFSYLDDSRDSFPLPPHPLSKLSQNKISQELPMHPSHKQLSTEIGNCSTLPSSYRLHSKKSAVCKNSLHSPQSEVNLMSLVSKNRSNPNLTRRDSAPQRFVSPLSSPTLNQKRNLSSPMLNVKSPTFSNCKPPRNPLASPTETIHRTPSPSRRMPLTTVHNRSPKRGNSPASLHKEELKGIKLPTKIPSPSQRSGIPVPSYFSKNSDDTWRQDCF